MGAGREASGYAFDSWASSPPTAPCCTPPRTSAPAATTCPPPSACSAPGSSSSSSTRSAPPAPMSASAPPPQRFQQDADGVDVRFSDGTSRPLRPGDRRRRAALRHPRHDRHHRRTRAHRHGHLAYPRAPPGRCPPHRPGLRRPLLHRRLLPDQREHHLRLPRRTGPRPGLTRPGRLRRRDAARSAQGYGGVWEEITRRISPTRRPSTTPGSTGCWSRALAPRPGRAHRRRRPLPARPPSPRAPRCPWRTPWSSPTC